MRYWVGLLFALLAAAQQPVERGVLLERDAQAAAGEFSLRTADNRVFRFSFDRKTYVEREDKLIDVARLQPGERIEVVSDKASGSVWRYARTVHVVAEAPPRRPPNPARPRPLQGGADRAAPVGNLSFSGVVSRLGENRLVLRTREGEQTLLLLPDTRYLENGEIVDAAALKPNMRVFVRAGQNIWEQVEAFQVIWGAILEPR
jgi:hypothetical protein